jgi:hypothetical protein
MESKVTSVSQQWHWSQLLQECSKNNLSFHCCNNAPRSQCRTFQQWHQFPLSQQCIPLISLVPTVAITYSNNDPADIYGQSHKVFSAHARVWKTPKKCVLGLQTSCSSITSQYTKWATPAFNSNVPQLLTKVLNAEGMWQRLVCHKSHMDKHIMRQW